MLLSRINYIHSFVSQRERNHSDPLSFLPSSALSQTSRALADVTSPSNAVQEIKLAGCVVQRSAVYFR